MELLPDGKMVLDEQDTVGVLALIYAKTRLSTFTPQRTRLYQRVTPGKYKGRPVSIDAAQIKQLRAELGPAAIAKRLGIRPEFGLPRALPAD